MQLIGHLLAVANGSVRSLTFAAGES